METKTLINSVEEIRGSPLSDDEVEELVDRVTKMAISYGLHRVIITDGFPAPLSRRPFTLFPSPMPRQLYDQAKRLHTHFQTVMYKVAKNHDFLYECFKSMLPVDDFIRALWDIYETVRQEGTDQISFLLSRNDFLMEPIADRPGEFCMKQVEFNTFAAAAAGVISPLVDIHRYSMSLAEIPFTPEQLPENQPSVGLARGICKAWELYDKPKSFILFVIEASELNTDQLWFERDICHINPSIRVIYGTFERLRHETKLTANRELFVGNKEVAVVYFRYGYSPNQYTSEDFDLRLTIERSKAIKCPSVALHLAGCKKVQQMLSVPGTLERFLDDASVISDMRKTFTEQVGLDQDESMVDQVKQAPEKYVLKPQREGGGNNLFGEGLLAEVDNIYNSAHAPCWIVMDRIQGHRHGTRLISVKSDTRIKDVVSELGIYGVHIGTANEELVNFECGHLIRTKPAELDEGGICVGNSLYDSPFLIG